MTTTYDAIELAASGQADRFREAVSSVLMNKVSDRLAIEKITVAQKFFNQEHESQDTGVTSNEEL